MEENHNNEDSSHYEISLTAGQAFIAFVLLLFSLAAAFAFGVIVGKDQYDESMAEAASGRQAAQQARIAELGSRRAVEPREGRTTPANSPVIIEEALASDSTAAERASVPLIEPANPPAPVPHFAQLLSSTDVKAAEQLAAKLIEAGFTTAYVERSSSPRGAIHRVRVKFPSETDARASVAKLKRFAAGEIWIARE